MLTSLFWVLMAVAAATTTPQPKGAKGCDGDDCTTPQPKVACEGDDCTTPQPKTACEGDDCTTPQPKSSDGDDTANNGKGSSSDDEGPNGGKSGSEDGPDSKQGGGGQQQHGWMPPQNSGMNKCDDLLDAAMGGTIENPDFTLDGGMFSTGDEYTTTTTTTGPDTTDIFYRDDVINPECLHAAVMSGDLTGSSMCNGVDFMGIHTVATEACMAESVDGVASSSMIKCVDGTGYIYEWENEDCSGDAVMTLGEDYNMTVNCDAFGGDCDYLILRRGDEEAEDECSYENYYDMAVTMGDCYDVGGLGVAYVSMSCEDEELVISEYLEDGCTGTPLNVTTQHMTNPNVQAGGKGSEDGPNSGKSSSSSEDGPEGKEPGTDGQSGSKSSGDGSQDGPDGEGGGKGRRLLASTTPQPKGAKGCDGDDCTTPQPKGCDGDDCTTPQPKGCDGDDCTTPQPKNGDDTANNGKGSSDDANNGKGSSSDDQGPDGPSGSRDSEDAPDGKGGSNSLESQCVEIVYCSTTGYTNEDVGGDGYGYNSGASHLAASVWMVVAAYFVM